MHSSSARASMVRSRRHESGTAASLRGWLGMDTQQPTAKKPSSSSGKVMTSSSMGHGLFVDDLQTASTSQTLMGMFLEEYSREFEITGGEVMSTFLGLQVDQVQSEIQLNMDNYVSSILSGSRSSRTSSARRCALRLFPWHRTFSSSRRWQPRDVWLPRIHLDRISDHL